MNIFAKLAAEIQIDDRSKHPRLLSRTLGRLVALPTDLLIFHAPSAAFRDPVVSKVKHEAETVAKGEKLPPLKVRVGGTNTIDDYKRLWANKRIWLPTKLLGSLALPLQNTSANLMRSDHYNPLTEAATVYTDLPGIAAHETGHHTSFGKSNWPYLRQVLYGGFFPATLYEEGIATHRALKKVHGKIKQEQKGTLYPAFGSYAGMIAGPGGALLGAQLGHVVKDEM